MIAAASHPMAGKPVKIANGPLKGKYFVVIDWLVNQYQGKRVEKIAASYGRLYDGVRHRGFPVDEKVVWGKMYPTMELMCVHDMELASTSEAPEPDVALIAHKEKEKKANDSARASKPDHRTDEPGSVGDDGRGVSSPGLHGEAAASTDGEGRPDSKADSGPGGKKPRKARDNKPKAGV